jgi:nicotinamidase-related amidase
MECADSLPGRISRTSAPTTVRIRSSTARYESARRSSSPTARRAGIRVLDTWNTAILDELAPKPGDPIVSKHRYSGFVETELK